MSLNCKICLEDLSNDGDYLMCSYCKEELHYSCGGVKESSWHLMSNPTKAVWKCVECRALVNIQKLLDNKFKELTKSINDGFDEVDIRISLLNNTLDTMGNTIYGLCQKLKELQETVIKAGRKAVLFVSQGNICRSPIAACVFKYLNKADKWTVDSAGTGDYHVGHPADSKARDVLSKQNVPCDHQARRVVAEDFQKFDYILIMDDANFAEVKSFKERAVNQGFKANAKILYLGDYDPQGVKIIDDPFSKDKSAFDVCYQHCYRSCEQFLKKVENNEV